MSGGVREAFMEKTVRYEVRYDIDIDLVFFQEDKSNFNIVKIMCRSAKFWKTKMVT